MEREPSVEVVKNDRLVGFVPVPPIGRLLPIARAVEFEGISRFTASGWSDENDKLGDVVPGLDLESSIDIGAAMILEHRSEVGLPDCFVVTALVDSLFKGQEIVPCPGSFRLGSELPRACNPRVSFRTVIHGLGL